MSTFRWAMRWVVALAGLASAALSLGRAGSPPDGDGHWGSERG